MAPDAIGIDKRFYLGMAVLLAAVIFVGFAPSFYLKSVIQAPTPPLTPLTITHGAVYTAWVALFVTQAALIGIGKPRLHRQLGILGAMLFGGMLVLGISTAITAARLGHAPPGMPPATTFLALPVIGLILPAGLITAALLLRTRRDWHMRLMLSGMLMLTPPATGRLAVGLGVAPLGFQLAMVVVEVLLAAAIAYDVWTRKRIHPAYGWAVAATVAEHALVTWAFGGAAWWAAIAGWLTR
ncbi:MAG TPA: hypothetical protein VF459_03245 [Caulobacteraceae bacterium]